MKFVQVLSNKRQALAAKMEPFLGKVRPYWQKTAAVFGKIGHVLDQIFDYTIMFRKAILTIPVAVGAVYLAVKNSHKLPETVGLILKSSGEFEYMIPRNIAVYGPLAVTAVCLLLMMCSHKTLYPWVISIFSLVLPLLILFTNLFPA